MQGGARERVTEGYEGCEPEQAGVLLGQKKLGRRQPGEKQDKKGISWSCLEPCADFSTQH